MREVLGIFAVFLWPSLAAAQGLLPGAASVGIGAEEEGGAVVVGAQDCARLVAHTPAADVAYRSGIDVEGNPVVPADTAVRFRAPTAEDIVISIEIDLRRKYGIPPGSGRYEGVVAVGEVAFENGKAYFNGQPLASDDEQALAAACQRHGF